MSYSSNGNRPKRSEKGLLTPDNCVVALIDHQGQMLFGTSNSDRQGIIRNGARARSLLTREAAEAAEEQEKANPKAGTHLAEHFCLEDTGLFRVS